MMKLSILLTATIKPSVVGGNFTVQERYEMYRSILTFYSKVVGKRYNFVFVENSNVDLTSLKKEFEDKLNIEFLQFTSNAVLSDSIFSVDKFDNTKGKGYNEYLMIKKAILQSKYLNEASHFLKITGRYAMVNILTMIREIEYRCNQNIVFMGDIKDTCIWELLHIQRMSHWGDSRFFVAQIAFYKNKMLDCYQEMNDYESDKWAEHYLLNFSRQYRGDSRCIFRFRHQVQFNGVSGTVTSERLCQGIRTQASFSNRMKNEIRHILRVLFPNIWF